jgi:hypothetical protein
MEPMRMNYATVYLGHSVYDATDPYLGPMLETVGRPSSDGSQEDITECIKEDDLKGFKALDWQILYYQGYLIDALVQRSFKIANWCHKKALKSKECCYFYRELDDFAERYFHFNRDNHTSTLKRSQEYKNEQDLIARLNQSPLVKDIVKKFLYPTPYEEKTTSTTDNDFVEGLGCPPSDV